VDGELRYCHCIAHCTCTFKGHRTAIAQRGVAAHRIVEPLHVIEDVRACLVAREIPTSMAPLGLQRREKWCEVFPGEIRLSDEEVDPSIE
jgi:hypothetical protein